MIFAFLQSKNRRLGFSVFHIVQKNRKFVNSRLHKESTFDLTKLSPGESVALIERFSNILIVATKRFTMSHGECQTGVNTLISLKFVFLKVFATV